MRTVVLAATLSGGVAIGSGIAMTIAGLVWHFAEPIGPTTITVGPILSRTTEGLALRLTF